MKLNQVLRNRTELTMRNFNSKGEKKQIGKQTLLGKWIMHGQGISSPTSPIKVNPLLDITTALWD